jgi:N-acetylglucosaminyldiphosphoundecaprenol N-acetyl-beta-D-mannosaminyltransferase
MNRIRILNTNIDNYSMEETLQTVVDAIEANKQIHHVVVNAGKIVAMQKNAELRESVNSSDLINADPCSIIPTRTRTIRKQKRNSRKLQRHMKF